MDQAFRAAAGIADPSPEPHADPSRDIELAPSDPRLNRNPSRASLPISHRRSISTFGRSRPSSAAGGHPPLDGAALEESQTGDRPADEEEIPWGPEHPCFPHPNPHVPLSSPLYETTRIIRIRRDWMPHGDLAPAFSNVYPEILDPLVPEDRFRALITKLNMTLEATFIPTTPRNWFDTIMGLLTGWLWDDFGFTGIKHSLKSLESWIEAWNRNVGAPEGVTVIPLRRTAYTCLDIQIPDPQISLIEGESTMGGDRGDASTNRASTIGSRGPRTSGIGASRGRHANLRDDVEYGPYPVPPIPDRFLDKRGTWDSARGRQEENGINRGEGRDMAGESVGSET